MNNNIENDNEETSTYALISYKNAVEYMHNNFILCNNISEIDEYLFENCELCNPEEDFYQYFLTDCSKDDAERLHKWFGLNRVQRLTKHGMHGATKTPRVNP